MEQLLNKHSFEKYDWNDKVALKSEKDLSVKEQKPHTDYKEGTGCIIAFIGLQVIFYFFILLLFLLYSFKLAYYFYLGYKIKSLEKKSLTSTKMQCR